MHDDGGLSLQLSTERLLFLLGWHNIELHGNAWRVENVEERHQKASSNTKPGSNKWNDILKLQTFCAVKRSKEVSKRVLLSIESMFIEAFNAQLPHKNRLFRNSDRANRLKSHNLETAGKVLHSSRSFGSLAPRCWNGARLRSCRHLAP